jgi:hypothetical protein
MLSVLPILAAPTIRSVSSVSSIFSVSSISTTPTLRTGPVLPVPVPTIPWASAVIAIRMVAQVHAVHTVPDANEVTTPDDHAIRFSNEFLAVYVLRELPNTTRFAVSAISIFAAVDVTISSSAGWFDDSACLTNNTVTAYDAHITCPRPSSPLESSAYAVDWRR